MTDIQSTPNWVTEGLLISPVAPPGGSFILEPNDCRKPLAEEVIQEKLEDAIS
jgi:hypothetical protein